MVPRQRAVLEASVLSRLPREGAPPLELLGAFPIVKADADLIQGRRRVDFLALVVRGGVNEKRSLRGAAAGGGVAVIPPSGCSREPTTRDRRRGCAGAMGAASNQSSVSKLVLGWAAEGAEGAWAVESDGEATTAADLGAAVELPWGAVGGGDGANGQKAWLYVTAK